MIHNHKLQNTYCYYVSYFLVYFVFHKNNINQIEVFRSQVLKVFITRKGSVETH